MVDGDDQANGGYRHYVRFGKRRMPLPASRIARIAIGVALIVGGLFSFLPVLGVWMLPLGLIVLSVDFAIARRMRRRGEVWWGRRRRKRQPDLEEPPPEA